MLINRIILSSLVLFLNNFPYNHSYAKETSTGLPLPRFASLRSNKVNVRTGPGLRYPIEWVYQKREMPIEIIAEYETWRKIKDWQDTLGWVHQSMLSGKRMFIIINSPQAIRKRGKTKSIAIAEAEPGVIGTLKSCKTQSDWCRVQIGEYNGWLRRTQIWGAYKNESIQ